MAPLAGRADTRDPHDKVAELAIDATAHVEFHMLEVDLAGTPPASLRICRPTMLRTFIMTAFGTNKPLYTYPILSLDRCSPFPQHGLTCNPVITPPSPVPTPRPPAIIFFSRESTVLKLFAALIVHPQLASRSRFTIPRAHTSHPSFGCVQPLVSSSQILAAVT